MNRQEIIGKKIKELRELQGVSQEALGKKTGYSAMGISYFEKGLRGLKITDLEKIAKALNVDISVFLGVFEISGKSSTIFLRSTEDVTEEAKEETIKTVNDFDTHLREIIAKRND